ncbi:MAG: serine/threonine-protein phosphatase [Leptospirales bacterium]|nr:serine/threonine-protein phosphatase [Leptospirales bacterium]HMW58790.1 PP2C family protein-serine/threonine phosphatase [Leptospiraceae bacterium]HNJ36045.1 PP2C family protein-serine/threonine phosphatase [Leptospiraceae bacterium]HNL02877.1 PP2C family protein-serine/threonine phosphatase [Leptospiraceae bacterium]HNL68518.1 PP2C family protein-serine/threonine phosphatase [Leptospiraceae bacterium]
MDEDHILTLLAEHALIREDQAARVKEIHASTGRPTGSILLSERFLDEKQLYAFICQDLGMNPASVYQDKFYEISGLTIPKFEVSGDFYGSFMLDEGRIALTLSDVSGKGIEAGLLAILLANILRTGVRMKNIIPSMILRKVNHASTRFFGEEQFATFIVLILDMHSGTVEFCCAGSPPILVYRRRENYVEQLEVKGIPVGIYDDFLFNGSRTSIEKGDVILMYTDGAYENQNFRNEYFGLRRVKDSLRKNSPRTARKIIHAIKREIKLFSMFRGLNDDTTFVSIKRSDRGS